MRPHRVFEVYERRGRLYTRNLLSGVSVYGERLVSEGGKEFREWDARRSKLAAAIAKGCPNLGIREGDCVLYLGCASGTTASHVSDIIGRGGFLFGLDSAPRVLRRFVKLCEQRPNMAPLLADAAKPDTYAKDVTECDVVVQDIAQRDQVGIFLKNVDRFLKKGGYALLAVKARSVDVAKKPRQVFREVQKRIEERLTLVDTRVLDPFEMDHCLFIVKK